MLCTRFDLPFLEGHILPLEQRRPFPRACERGAWTALLGADLQRQRSAYLIGVAETLVDKPWPQTTAKLYAEFVRDGNRSHFQEVYFERRVNLGLLVMAECLEGRGRFVDEIVTGLLHILEEFTWCLPAHSSRHEGDILEREDCASVDLFACETAAVIAETLYLLEGELRAVSLTLVRRLKKAVFERVIEPVEGYLEHMWWSRGHNNWTPWCASNVLGAAFYLMEDRARLARLLHERLNPCIDRFLEKYPQDGCCDEGPGYWNASPGALLIYLEHFHALTGGSVSIYDEEQLRAMGEYVANAHLCGPWVVNFADARANLNLKRPVVWRFGERIGSEAMKSLVEFSMRGGDPAAPVAPLIARNLCGGDLCFMLREMFWIPAEEAAGELVKQRTVWYPHTQVLIARESEESSRGLILAAKGGHNAENHNHNDIGHAIIMCEGEPFIVDAGVGTYSRTTFSEKRYSLWYMRSGGHNAPILGGVEQATGAEYRATEVSFEEDKNSRILRMELRSAYPAQTPCSSCRRTFTLAGGVIRLEDRISSEKEIPVELRLLTPATVVRDGEALLLKKGGVRMRLQWEGALEQIEIEELELEDVSLREVWGKALTRIVFRGILPPGGNSYALTFTRAGD
ncbi:MAG: heparinase II/III family protein [Planctomycetes bacterium]|nr:heparinase II/III family protein [Planctomycetota bacterium]